MSFKKNLKIELFYNSMTLKELAEKTGITYGTLLAYTSTREVIPSLENAYLISKALNVSIEYLLTGEDIALETAYPKVYNSIKELLALPKSQVEIITDMIHELYSLNYLK